MIHYYQIKGQVPLYYKEGPKKGSDEWPPRFLKVCEVNLDHSGGIIAIIWQFIISLSLEDDPSTITEVAFVDARRLARIRLCQAPLTELPISSLGFDPLLSMISLEDFTTAVLKRSCPVKALLLDQSFSAGIGNWVAGTSDLTPLGNYCCYIRSHDEKVIADPGSF